MKNEKFFSITDEELKENTMEIILLLKKLLATNEEIECLDVEDVAQILKHSTSQVRKLIKAKKIKAFHSGTSIKVRKIKLREYIEEQEKIEEVEW